MSSTLSARQRRSLPARLAAAAGVVVVLTALLATWGRWLNQGVPDTEFVSGFWTLLAVGGATYGATGGWLAALRPRMPLGWLMLLVGAVLAVGAAGAEYAIAVVDRHPDWPLAGGALWFGVWTWAMGYLLVGLVLPLLLPEGRLASPRHRPLLVAAVLAVVANSFVFAVTPYAEQEPPVVLGGLTNPFGVGWSDAPWLRLPLVVLTVLCLVSGLVLLLRRWAAAQVERSALSTTVLGILATVVVALAAFVAPASWVPVLLALAAVPLPVSCVVAVLRHGLGDVDVVLSRALAYAVLSVVAAGAYVVLVSLLGGLLGSGTGAPVIATAVVAVLVAPLHRRVQRLVNRVVHGTAEDPYASLARLGERLEAAREPSAVADEVLPALVTALARALRRPVALLLRDGTRVGSTDTETLVVPLSYVGEALGELRVGTAAGALSRSERRLVDGLARQAAVAVHGVLLARALTHSREQIVSAREEERRRIRHDLHDGVGPALAAAALQVETARETYLRDPDAAGALLDRVAGQLNTAVGDVRQLVRGLRPAGLDDLGLTAALVELAGRFDSPGTQVSAVVGDLPHRSAAVDAAVYLVVAEALANAVRHARPRRVRVEVCGRDGGVALSVEDDGSGMPGTPPPGTGLSSMRDRVEQLAGHFAVEPRAGGGTRVSAWLPEEAP